MQILAVVVLYKTTFEDSHTVQSLRKALVNKPELRNSVQVLFWDNSPESIEGTEMPFPCLYKHSIKNLGLSGAYNSAAAMADEQGIPWLLLLDQDTRLPESFLPDMLRHAEQLTGRREIAAIAPTVGVGDFVVSPWLVLFNRHRSYADGESQLADGEATAINSGSLLRVKALLAIGGYSEEFWLDYSDRYVYHQLFRKGYRVWRATDIRMQHSMTVMDYDNLMSTWRYKNFIYAEGAFNDLYKGWQENAVQTLRLAARVFRQRKRFKNPEFSRITLRYLFYRLSVSKHRRIKRWRERSFETV